VTAGAQTGGADPAPMDPAATYAVVVGIERYDADGWDLPGAARDAVRVVAWLRAAGVPAGQITLAVDALPAHRDEIAAAAAGLGVALRATARRDELIAVFTDELREHTARQNLLVYWSGHGALDEQRRRALFTSDAGPNDKRNIRIDDLLEYLIDREVTGFHRQIVLVDACANFVESMRNRTVLTRATFPVSGVRRAGVGQFVIYAAAQGKLAGNQQVARAGAFTDAMLAWLHGEAVRWPPDMPQLSAFIAQHLTSARDAGETLRAPVSLVRTVDWSGSQEEHDFGGLPVTGTAYLATIATGRTPSQLRRLATLLAASGVLDAAADRNQLLAAVGAVPTGGADEDLQAAVTAALSGDAVERLFAALDALADTEDERLGVARVRRLWQVQSRIAPLLARFNAVTAGQLRHYFDVVPNRRLAEEHQDLDRILEYLADLGGAGADAPLARFVARLEQLVGVEVPDDWFGLSAAVLDGLRGREHEAVDRRHRSHLVLDLHPPGSDAVDRLAGFWPGTIVGHLRTGDGAWTKRAVNCPGTLADVQQAVNVLINWAYEHQADVATMTLGFLAPRARFDDRPERWTYSDEFTAPVPLHEVCPVMLHFRDRLGVPRARVQWRMAARRIAGEVELGAPSVLWLPAPADGRMRSISEQVAAVRAACIGFGFVPGPLRGDLRDDPIVAAANAGAPYILWFDAEPADWDEVRSALAAVIQQGAFDDVPLRLQRLSGYRGNGGDVPAVRLVWDNQDWIPEPGRLAGLAIREVVAP
jgi:hypothetical protein